MYFENHPVVFAEVFKAVVMESYIFWDKISCSPLKFKEDKLCLRTVSLKLLVCLILRS
jgi:hypothetical protein